MKQLAELKDLSHPRHPPRVLPSSTLQTPPKHSPIKPPAHNGSPNYMKSTTSSEARKERSNQVSPRRNLFASDAAKIQTHRLPKHFSSSSSTNSSSASLRPVRTLTKIPGLKPARSSATICSQAALCADLNAQRPTCSSTLKDTKLPSYLMLGPGGTESQGTSAVKVCPYTYCSLNDHYQNPVSPLKCFLSARRRALKTQKNMIKCEAPSPRSVKKSVDEELEDEDTVQNLFPDKLSDGEDDSSINPAISKEGWANFFIEIHANKEDSGHYGAFPQAIEEVDESVSDGSPQLEIDSQEQPEDNNFGNFKMLVASNTLLEKQNEQSDAPFSEASDIDWEEGVFAALVPDLEQGDNSQSKSGADSSNEDNHATVLNGEIEESSEENITAYHQDTEIIYEKDENAEQAYPKENEDLITQRIFCSNNHATRAIQEVNDEDDINESIQEDATTGSCRVFEEEGIFFETQGRAFNEQFHLQEEANGENCSKNGRNIIIAEKSRNVEEQTVGDISKRTSVEDAGSDVDRTGGHDGRRFDAAVACYNVDDSSAATCNDLKGRMRCPRPEKETEDPRGFNPREPNYLPVEPSPDAEKVDLKHQMMDERKNAEEWMIDNALQRKLAPAQKRKVALLVEAFETVVPMPPKPAASIRVRHGSVGFAQVRPIQACS